MNALNEYVRQNPTMEEARDPGWGRYRDALQNLKEKGRMLRSAIFRADAAGAEALESVIKGLPVGTPLNVFCNDGEVTLPLGFLFDAEILPTVINGKPSVHDFADFWLFRFKLTMFVEGGGCEGELGADPNAFKALYALHETALGNAASIMEAQLLEAELQHLKRLLNVDVGTKLDWNETAIAWRDIREMDNIIFVFAHSDGDSIELSNCSQKDCLTIAEILEKGGSEHPTLLILNCCLSASGKEGASLLSVIARKGFCGMIGTEAEILNTYALRCGTRLMWELCANGARLGDAFESMRYDPDLFPLNLFYTCYADRRFHLTQPLTELMRA
ncbi:hypothetical protein FHX06_005695 [Rhizobium sp. BK512]|uniref:hypothetical protein n=1 Tax=Rhizobium sp. BK512 TaxID=2587010 RepID=UPI001618D67C|nr:hypothetical protein [Rhizobium sp. BK512]MBB3564331.1 hypothetical protein [Rhizobium sp. BK512]